MEYRDFGRSGVKLSRLGFGAMRLPMMEKDGKQVVNDELAIPALQRAYEKGVNYFDTAWGYCERDSQRATGKAIKPFRDKVYLSTKLPMWYIEKPDDFWYYLEKQLTELDTDYIDFYHFHSVNRAHFREKILPFKLIDLAEQAKAKGMIKYLSFSFHDTPDIMKEIADTGAFDSLLCQYNLIDRTNEEMMRYCKEEKNMGIVNMGPVGGGNIAHGGEEFIKKFKTKAKSGVELAFRFVYGFDYLDCSISGMESIEMVEENAAIFEEAARTMTKEEWNDIAEGAEEILKLSDLYCTGCNYCNTCPTKIPISTVFKAYNMWKVWGLPEPAKRLYKGIEADNHPSKCISCMICMENCPQKIEIPGRLATAISELETL